MSDKLSVFISYSHQDEEWLERVKTFLRPLERDAELRLWSDSKIKPSSNWREEIRQAIDEADAAILLVSQDFLASDFIATEELPPLLNAASDGGLRVYPIFVSSCFLKNSPLSEFQAINSPTSHWIC